MKFLIKLPIDFAVDRSDSIAKFSCEQAPASLVLDLAFEFTKRLEVLNRGSLHPARVAG